MKGKQIWAMALAVIMGVSFLPADVLANVQNPIQGIEKVTVFHEVDNSLETDLKITPKVQVDWIEPLKNDPPNVTNGDNTLEPTHYTLNVKNVYNTINKSKDIELEASTIQRKNGKLSLQLYEYFNTTLKNGSLYSTEIIAKHKHKVTNTNGGYRWVDAPSASTIIPKTYYITDFNIKASTEDGLIFSWEYIPNVSYRLFYEKGNINSIASMSKEGILISPTQARANLSADKTKVEWKIKEAEAGQVYSAYVVPEGIDHNTITFKDISYNATTPKIVRAIPSIKLTIDPVGRDKIRLSWNIKDASWTQIDNELYETVIQEIDTDGKSKEIGRIKNYNFGNKDVGYFETSAPKTSAKYEVKFILKTGTGQLQEAFNAGPKEYVPEQLKEVPFQPYIPEAFKYKEEDIVSANDIVSQNKFKVKFDKDYDDLKLTTYNIGLFKEHTFHYEINENKADIQVVWDAPKDTDTGEVDYNLYYDLWVSENPNEFGDNDKVVGNLSIQKEDTDYLILKQDQKTVVGFKTLLSGFTPNKTYYVKMVAKRNYGDREFTISTPIIREISVGKVGDVYNPPVMGKPPLQIDNTTQNSITIKWAEQWYEIMAKLGKESLYNESETEKVLAKWGSSRVYLDKNKSPVLRFWSEDIGVEAIDLYGTPQQVQDKFAKIEAALGSDINNYVKQFVQTGEDTGYKIKVLTQQEVENQRGEQSLQEWIQNTQNKEYKSWEDITGNLQGIKINGMDGKSAIIKNDYQGNPLVANTPYIILITAYRLIDGEEVHSVFPSYIIGTTATDHQSEIEIPTTPHLYNKKEEDVEDTQIAVRWTYYSQFDYELVYSRLDDPNQAQVWTFTDTDKKSFAEGQEAYVTITGLLPETSYNIWIRAVQKKENLPQGVKPKPSDWSTPVTSLTKPLENPLPPTGLGLAAYESIQEAGKDFAPRGSDYLTIEWMKHMNDNAQLLDKRFSYAYQIEFADNVDFLDAITVTTGAAQTQGTSGSYEILAKNLVRFTKLRGNTPYYVRVKTILTFTGNGKVIVKESDFSKWVRLITSASNDEYDGGENDNIVIYPNAIEETYQNGIWTYEIVDAAKIITQMQNQKKYLYTITLENYKNRYDATVRRIQMPKKVLDTLINQSMALQVVTNKGIYEIPGKALQSYANQYSAKDMVRFDFTQMSASDIVLYTRSYPEYYRSGEKLDITIQNAPIYKLQTYMTVKLKKSGVSVLSSSLNTYQYQYASSSWQKYTHTLDPVDNNYISYSTAYTGLNALYETMVFTSGSASYAMSELASNYQIGGLGTTYTKTQTVGASQYVNLLLGIQLGRTPINLSASVAASDYAKAKAAGLYMSSNREALTKEQALAGIVKLYEMTHGYQIKPSNQVFNKVSTNYRQAVSKAYAIGLIESMENPQSTLNYELLCDWILQVIE